MWTSRVATCLTWTSNRRAEQSVGRPVPPVSMRTRAKRGGRASTQSLTDPPHGLVDLATVLGEGNSPHVVVQVVRPAPYLAGTPGRTADLVQGQAEEVAQPLARQDEPHGITVVRRARGPSPRHDFGDPVRRDLSGDRKAIV